MTDNDKARDVAIQQIEKSLAGRPLSSFEQLLICRGWNAAVAHAEAQHAEKVKEIVTELEKIANRAPTHWHRELSDLIYKYRGKHEHD